MQRQLEQIIVAATLTFLLGCHAGLSKLLPLIPALILAAFFLLLLAWGCRQKAGVKLLAAAGIGLCFCCGAASGSGAMRQPQLPLQTFTGQEVRLFGIVEAGSVKVTPQGTSLVLACHTLQQAMQTNSAELGSSLPDTAIAVSGKVRVLVQGQDLSEKITSGVIVQGTLKPLTDFANPGGWDGGLWSELQDLQGRMSIKGSELYLSGDGQSIRQYIGGLAAGAAFKSAAYCTGTGRSCFSRYDFRGLRRYQRADAGRFCCCGIGASAGCIWYAYSSGDRLSACTAAAP